MGTIARVVKITPLEDIDKNKGAADYRAGCLALSPKERIEEIRRLSRRIISLNPNNPRSAHIEKIVSIVHDAV